MDTAPALLQAHERLVERLLRPAAYPHPVDRVERIDTHISTVLLAGDYAYKIKKPVDLGFLDFSTLDRRRRCCLEEVRLNRRTAPSLYLDAVPVTSVDGSPRVGGDGEAVEYAVRMRRFDPADTLDRLASAGRLDAGIVDRLAEAVARFHAAAEVAPPGAGKPDAARRLVEAALDAARSLAQGADERARLDAVAAWSAATARALAPTMAARVAQGRVRECHGDLHLANIVLLDGAPVPFDAIEFNEDLRCIDVVSDIAFTFMDLLDHGADRLAWRFVTRYLEETGDYEGLALLRYYAVYRAIVRAEVALIRVRQPDVRRQVRVREHASFAHYLALAERLVRPGTRALLVTTGLSGSGKSTVALALAQRLGGVRIRSDVERKRLFGYAPQARTSAALYAPEATERTYARMAEAARQALLAGYPAVVDGAFLRSAERERFRSLAGELGVRYALLACEAPLDVLRSRVEARLSAGHDPSEADVTVLERQLDWREPVSASERAVAMPVDTAGDRASVERALEGVAAALEADGTG